MSNPNPKTEHLVATQWQKGQTGNPDGSSRKQRISSAINAALDEAPEHQKDLILALVAMSTGKRALLNDANEEDGKRKPDLDWFKELRELIQGKPTEHIETKQTGEQKVLVVPDNKRRRKRPPDGTPDASGGASMGVPGE